MKMSDQQIEGKDVLVKMAKYCAYQDRCKKEVYTKLEALELDIVQQDIVIDYLIQEKYLDENRYICSVVRGRFFYKNWGKIKITHYLKQREIDTTIIEEVIDREISKEVYYQKAYDLVATKWQRTKGDTDFEIRQKVLSALYLKGFDSSLILDVIDDFLQD